MDFTSVSANWLAQAMLYLFSFFLLSKHSIQVKAWACGGLRSLLLKVFGVSVLQVAVTYKEHLKRIAVCLTMRCPISTGSTSHTDWQTASLIACQFQIRNFNWDTEQQQEQQLLNIHGTQASPKHPIFSPLLCTHPISVCPKTLKPQVLQLILEHPQVLEKLLLALAPLQMQLHCQQEYGHLVAVAGLPAL